MQAFRPTASPPNILLIAGTERGVTKTTLQLSWREPIRSGKVRFIPIATGCLSLGEGLPVTWRVWGCRGGCDAGLLPPRCENWEGARNIDHPSIRALLSLPEVYATEICGFFCCFACELSLQRWIRGEPFYCAQQNWAMTYPLSCVFDFATPPRLLKPSARPKLWSWALWLKV